MGMTVDETDCHTPKQAKTIGGVNVLFVNPWDLLKLLYNSKDFASFTS